VSLAIALSIVSILLSLPALFLSVYAIVNIKARELSEEMMAQGRDYSTDRVVTRQFEAPDDSGPGMYDLNDDDHMDYEDM
jgi:hypothetical protein